MIFVLFFNFSYFNIYILEKYFIKSNYVNLLSSVDQANCMLIFLKSTYLGRVPLDLPYHSYIIW